LVNILRGFEMAAISVTAYGIPVGEVFYSPGRLANPLDITVEGSTDYVVYTVPAEASYALVNLNVVNRDTTAIYGVCVAVSTSSSPTDQEFIQWNTGLQPRGVMELTNLVLARNEKLVVRFPGRPQPVNLVVNGTFATSGSPGTGLLGWTAFGSDWSATGGNLYVGGSVSINSSPSYPATPNAIYTYSFDVISGSFFDGSPQFSIAYRPAGGGAWLGTSISILSTGTKTGTWQAPANAAEIQLSFGTYSYTNCRVDNVYFAKNV